MKLSPHLNDALLAHIVEGLNASIRKNNGASARDICHDGFNFHVATAKEPLGNDRERLVVTVRRRSDSDILVHEEIPLSHDYDKPYLNVAFLGGLLGQALKAMEETRELTAPGGGGVNGGLAAKMTL